MKISKTQFINFMRCNRFVALNEIYFEKEKAIVSITDDIELENLMSLENEQYKSVILDSMYYFDSDEDLLHKENPQLEMMMPYYNELELISGKAIKERFKGDIVYDLNTFNQKRFNYLKEGFDFYCFLDGYQEDDQTIRVFETKATTSNKFSESKLYFKDTKEKENKSFFIKLPSGIYVPREDVEEVDENYYKKENQIVNRFNPVGRYIYDLAYQNFVFNKSNDSNKNVEYYLVVLNHEYVHDGLVDTNNNPNYNNNLVRFYNLTSLTNKMISILEKDTSTVIDRLNVMDARETDLGIHCGRGKNTECPFLDICYKDFPKDNSVFIYKERHHGFKEKDGTKHEFYDLVNDGARFALDIPREYLNRKNNQIQRDVISTGKTYYNVSKIRDGISKLNYPIYHLDFESFNSPLPRFKGEVPYIQSLFQYSIHIEKEPGVCSEELDHYGYLSKNHNDNRLELLESMLDIIEDDNGSILVYNVSFEQTRLKELGILFPEHKERLDGLIDRLFDLQHIVETNSKLYESFGYNKDEAKELNFYHEKLNGSYSIKKVLPLFTKLTYEGLRVGNGTDAMVAYSKFDKLRNEEFQETYNDLVNYCKQDTWAMVEILRELRKI